MQPGSGELNEINPPEFTPTLDDLYLQKLESKKPEIAHLLKRLSTETQYRSWLVERVVVINNALVASYSTNEEVRTLLREQNQLLREVTKRLNDVEKTTKENADTILKWTIKFQSPLAILASAIGVLVVAAAGAWAATWFK